MEIQANSSAIFERRFYNYRLTGCLTQQELGISLQDLDHGHTYHDKYLRSENTNKKMDIDDIFKSLACSKDVDKENPRQTQRIFYAIEEEGLLIVKMPLKDLRDDSDLLFESKLQLKKVQLLIQQPSIIDAVDISNENQLRVQQQSSSISFLTEVQYNKQDSQLEEIKKQWKNGIFNQSIISVREDQVEPPKQDSLYQSLNESKFTEKSQVQEFRQKQLSQHTNQNQNHNILTSSISEQTQWLKVLSDERFDQSLIVGNNITLEEFKRFTPEEQVNILTGLYGTDFLKPMMSQIAAERERLDNLRFDYIKKIKERQEERERERQNLIQYQRKFCKKKNRDYRYNQRGNQRRQQYYYEDDGDDSSDYETSNGQMWDSQSGSWQRDIGNYIERF